MLLYATNAFIYLQTCTRTLLQQLATLRQVTMVRMAKETAAFSSSEGEHCTSEPHRRANCFSVSPLFRVDRTGTLFLQGCPSSVPQEQPCTATRMRCYVPGTTSDVQMHTYVGKVCRLRSGRCWCSFGTKRNIR